MVLGADASLHLKPFGDQDAHVEKPLGTVGQAGWFPGAELASWGAGDAFVPAHACQLANHLTHQRLLLLLLQCYSLTDIKVRIFHSITEDNKHVFPSLNEPSRILAQETDVRLREFIKTDNIIKRMVLILEMQSWTMYNHKKNGLDLSRTRTHDMHKIH